MISLENLFFRYETDTPPILEGISLTFAEGSHTALIGPNGCGKTTLLKHLNGLLSPTTGRVSVDGMTTTDAATDATRIARASPVSASLALQCAQLNENRRMNQKTLAAGTAASH